MTKIINWRYVILILKKHGFEPKKNNGGSHQKFYNKKTRETAIVSAHKLGEDVKIGTAISVFKQAGIKNENK